jgi:transcriptional regulator with XRE-family HTH domain
MTDNEKIGKQIALLRKEKGLTGDKLSEILSVSPQAISKWENGKCLPETSILPLLSKTLGCSIDTILMPKKLQI